MAWGDRMQISKKCRFGVFQRDHFICQYCGRTPPDAILEVDHIVPRSQGGSDDEANLITSCFECNRGKSDGNIPVNAIPLELRVDVIREREDQLQAYYEIQKERYLRAEKDLEMVCNHYKKIADKPPSLTAHLTINIRNLLRTFTPVDVMEAMNIAIGRIGSENTEDWLRYMCGVLWNWKKGIKKQQKNKP